jgi:hypothetical protein
VVSDIKQLASGFQSCLFKHFSREVNVVAHVLARSSESESCKFYFDVVPDVIRKELCNDVM